MANPIQFIREVRSELSKVVWPTRMDVVRVTTAVVALSVAMAIFLGAIDYGLTQLFEWIINR
jgi:preprotein translocase subunit SecE